MAERQYPYGGHTTQEAGRASGYVTQRAGRADFPIVGGDISSAGLLLYAFVYEARWAGLKTTELCPRWQDLPASEREAWEGRAAEIAAFIKQGKQKKPCYCLGRTTIQQVATGEPLQTEQVDFIASDELFKNDPYKVLEEGLVLVESSIAHVSHGGPTRADAATWIRNARKALRPTSGTTEAPAQS